MQEYDRLMQDKVESAHFVGTPKDKGKRKKINEPKNEAANFPAQKRKK